MGAGTGTPATRGGLPRTWALRSVFVNAGGSALDYTILFLLVGLANAPLAPAALLGVSVGATFNFLVNRRCVFGDVADAGPLALRRQAVRYAAGIASLLLVHTGAVWLLASRWALPLVAVKPACDLAFLALGQLLLLRHVVFASPRSPSCSRVPSGVARSVGARPGFATAGIASVLGGPGMASAAGGRGMASAAGGRGVASAAGGRGAEGVAASDPR